MNDKHKGRYAAWERIRNNYKSNLAGASREDEAKIKATYRETKTKQYRTQFKKDFPEYEKQIEDNEDLARLAISDIKQVIAPFYPVIQNDSQLRDCRLTKPRRVAFDIAQVLIFGTTSISLACYDIITLTFCKTPPSITINLIGIGILLWAMNRKAPSDINKDASNAIFSPRILSFEELIKEIADHPNKYPARQYPNYKNLINNDQINSERGH